MKHFGSQHGAKAKACASVAKVKGPRRVGRAQKLQGPRNGLEQGAWRDQKMYGDCRMGEKPREVSKGLGKSLEAKGSWQRVQGAWGAIGGTGRGVATANRWRSWMDVTYYPLSIEKSKGL